MASDKTIKLNLGNGDLVAMAGAIRTIAKQYGKLRVPSMRANIENAKALFATAPEVEIFSVASMSEVIALKGLRFYEPYIPEQIDRDHYSHLYDMLGLQYSVRWTASPIPASRALAPIVPPPAWPYRFVHDDPSRGFVIRRLGGSMSIFKPIPHASTLLAWCAVIENAEEIHVIDSCFFHLTEHLEPKTGKLFLHRYARPYTPVWMDYQTKHDWTIVQ